MCAFSLAGTRPLLVVALTASIASVSGCGAPRHVQNFEARIQAEADAGNPNAQALLAMRHINDADSAQNAAVDIAKIRELANAGNGPAQLFLGHLYLYGRMGIPQDLPVGASWIKKAAEGGSTVAEAELAYLNGYGVGVAKDGAEALRLAHFAADKGSPDGYVAVGFCYAQGWGVAQDKDAAIGWYRKAADKGDPGGMMSLGAAYRDGAGVPADKVTAYAWYEVAVTNARYDGDRSAAQKGRDELSVVLLPDEVNEGLALARDWRAGADLAVKRAEQRRMPSETAVTANDTFMDTGAVSTLAGDRIMKKEDIPVVESQMRLAVDVNADGSHTEVYHSEVLIRKEAAIKDFGQRPIPYSSLLDKVDIVEAYTLKADGRKILVDASAIYEQAVPGTQAMPLFNDQKQKVIVYPNVEAGDTLVLTAKYVIQPLIPGFYSFDDVFNRMVAENDVRIRVTTPASMPLVTETHGMDFKRGRESDRNVYEWRYANPSPLVENRIALDAYDRAPRVFASSFGDYEQFARAYAKIVDSKTSVTPKIRSLADEITAGITEPRSQAAALHDWVSRHIRYVALELGRDAIVPHDPDVVIDNGYGDCKDHSALLVALLRAKGISANMVLINLGNSFTLAKPPTFATLNHAITYLPDFDLYTDTTAGVAPFGQLIFGEYGKPVIVVGETGQVVRRTPVLRSADASLTIKTRAELDTEGRISGESEIVGTGPFASFLKSNAISIQAGGPEQTAKSLLQYSGLDGTGSFDISSPYDPSKTYRIEGHFSTVAYSELLLGNSFFLPRGLGFGPRPGEDLMGPLDFMDLHGDEPTPCNGGREVEEISLKLPEGRKPRELPKDFAIRNDYMTYKSQWSSSGRTVTNRREFVSLVDQPVCIGHVRKVAAQALNDIRGDYRTEVAIAGK